MEKEKDGESDLRENMGNIRGPIPRGFAQTLPRETSVDLQGGWSKYQSPVLQRYLDILVPLISMGLGTRSSKGIRASQKTSQDLDLYCCILGQNHSRYDLI